MFLLGWVSDFVGVIFLDHLLVGLLDLLFGGGTRNSQNVVVIFFLGFLEFLGGLLVLLFHVQTTIESMGLLEIYHSLFVLAQLETSLSSSEESLRESIIQIESLVAILNSFYVLLLDQVHLGSIRIEEGLQFFVLTDIYSLGVAG